MAGDEPSSEVLKENYKYFGQAPGRRFWIIFAGAGLNYLLAFVIFCFVAPAARIGLVVKDMPAYKAGIESGDRILSVNNNRTEYWHQVIDMISSNHSAAPLSIQLERNGRVFEAVVVPEIAGEGDSGKIQKIGISSYGDIRFLKAPAAQYILTGMRQTLSNTVLTYRFIWYLITGKVALKGSATGPVGIAVIIGRAIHVGMAYLLYLIAHINLALAIFNLLPFPVLDGGHILLLGIEKIRKRPVSVRVQEFIQYAAIFLIILLFATVTWNDITTWIIKK
jgi:regulator of sigma E protease